MMEKCLIGLCQRPRANGAVYRGLCLVCYGTAKGTVAQGNTTWDELVSYGLALPDGNDPFLKALGDAKRASEPKVSKHHQPTVERG